MSHTVKCEEVHSPVRRIPQTVGFCSLNSLHFSGLGTMWKSDVGTRSQDLRLPSSGKSRFFEMFFFSKILSQCSRTSFFSITSSDCYLSIRMFR